MKLKRCISCSPCFPEENSDTTHEKVYDILFFETDVRAKFLTDNALPVGVEMLIEVALQLESDLRHLLLFV